jgi:hypothetical protein
VELGIPCCAYTKYELDPEPLLDRRVPYPTRLTLLPAPPDLLMLSASASALCSIDDVGGTAPIRLTSCAYATEMLQNRPVETITSTPLIFRQSDMPRQSSRHQPHTLPANSKPKQRGVYTQFPGSNPLPTAVYQIPSSHGTGFQMIINSHSHAYPSRQNVPKQ